MHKISATLVSCLNQFGVFVTKDGDRFSAELSREFRVIGAPYCVEFDAVTRRATVYSLVEE
jgi:hypothetical protein